MLELLINEETDKAKELFHDIVVEKSREIYESLLADDFNETTGEMPAGAEGELAAPDMPAEEGMGDEFSSDDETDDMMGDIEGDDDMGGDDMGGDDVTLSGDEVTDLQDRVVDLEDALDSLRDEFESLMGGEEDGEMGPEEPEMGDEEDEMAERSMSGMDDEESDMYGSQEDEAFIREYVEKVTAKMGDNGAFTKSTVAKKNDMGGVAGINKGGDGGKGGTQGGLLNPSTKDLASGNVNVPGGKAGVKHLKNVPAGHGAEKKGSKPDSEKSLLGK